MSAAPKFVDALPERGTVSAHRRELIAALANAPGTWAEVARTAKLGNSHARLSARAQYLRSLDPQVEAAVRTIDNNVVLFARVVAA